MNRWDRLAQPLGYVPRTVRLIWEAAGTWTIAWALLLVFQGLVSAASVYLTRPLVDGLAGALGSGAGGAVLAPLARVGGLMVTLILAGDLLQRALEWVRATQAELLQDHISGLVHDRSVAVDLEFYESSEYHDRLYRARNDASSRTLSLLESTGSLIQNGMTVIAMGALLIPYGPWLPLALVLGALPAFYVAMSSSRRYHRWWEQTTIDRRWAQYYDVMITHPAAAAELRLFGLGQHFAALFQSRRRRLRGESLRLIWERNLSQLGATMLAYAITGLAFAWMVWRALHGLVTLGDLALLYQAFRRGQGLLGALLGNAGQIYTNSLFLGNLFEFLGLEPHIAGPSQPRSCPTRLAQGITFHQVTFRYPGSERAALCDLDLTIPAGKITAIVGPNGAGKSTMIKLLCRFYEPQAGKVTMDGIDLRELTPTELRQRISILFQMPVTYQATAAENIALGNLAGQPNLEQIELAARKAGAHEVIARLPQGYDTLLGKWFANGAELSMGEWQRLALARAYLREAPIIVLDEPTSAMDSWAEIEWFDRFRDLAASRTSLIITHRFTTAMRADLIYVMDGGRVVEQGSHRELLAQGGLYAQSWAAQMRAGHETTETFELSSVPLEAPPAEPR